MIFIISKIFTALFLPPGILLPILLYLGWKNPAFKKAFLSLALFWYLLTITPTSLLPLKWLEKDSLTFTQNRPNAVVVLAGGVGVGHPNLPLSSDALKRALAGVHFAKKHNIPLFYTGGGTKQLSESSAFIKSLEYTYLPFNALLLVDKFNGFDHFYIVLEDKSLDTFENGKYIASLMPAKSTIALVSSAYHLLRAKIIFEHFGFEVLPIPTDFKRDYPANLTWRDWLPSLEGLKRNYIVLHEIVGIASLILRGIWPF